MMTLPFLTIGSWMTVTYLAVMVKTVAGKLGWIDRTHISHNCGSQLRD
jgi:hypothetical protein